MPRPGLCDDWSMKLSSRMLTTRPSPIMEAKTWLAHAPQGVSLLDLSQAAPADPPAPEMLAAMAREIVHDDCHRYGPILGNASLRAAIAARWSAIYGADLDARHVGITAGCNQAFCAAIAALAGPGDTVVLATPYYFNHAMRLQYAGINIRLWTCTAGMMPDLAALPALMDGSVRAIVLVSPSNPTGAEYDDQTLNAVFEIAKAHDAAMILDETYLDFRTGSGPPHSLLARPDWQEVFIHLYSFSKVYRIPGHRVGALVAGGKVMAEVEKYLDCETICASQIGQRSALFGIEELAADVARMRQDINARRLRLLALAAQWPGWTIASSGAYFAFAMHPFAAPASKIAKDLVTEEAVLVLPGEMFAPEHSDAGRRGLRIAFANVANDGLETLSVRVQNFTRRQDGANLA